jgi:hypothetical protein
MRVGNVKVCFSTLFLVSWTCEICRDYFIVQSWLRWREINHLHRRVKDFPPSMIESVDTDHDCNSHVQDEGFWDSEMR